MSRSATAAGGAGQRAARLVRRLHRRRPLEDVRDIRRRNGHTSRSDSTSEGRWATCPRICRSTPPCAPSWPTSCCPAWTWNRTGSGPPAPHCRSGSPGRIGELLARRDELQAQVDAWHREHGAGDVAAYEAFLTEIGYLLPVAEPAAAGGRRRPGDRRDPRPAAGGAGHRAAVRAERGQRPLGFAVRRPLRHRRAAARPRARARLRRAPRRPGDRRGGPAAGRALPARLRQPRRRDGVPRGRRRAWPWTPPPVPPALADPASSPGTAGGRARHPAAPQRAARRADHRPGDRVGAPAPRRASPTSCWSRPSPRSSTSRTRWPRWTARTRRVAYRTWLGLMTGDADRHLREGRPDRRADGARRPRATPPRTAPSSSCPAARCCWCATAGTT